MKRLLSILLCLLSSMMWVQSGTATSLVGSHTSTATFAPFTAGQLLHSADVCGSVTLNSDSSLVRIIMDDTAGNRYLVYEATPMLLNGYTDTLDHVAEETFWMCGVQAATLKLVVKDATLSVTSFNTTIYNPTVHLHKAPIEMESIRRSQVQVKVDRINAYNASRGYLWRAEVTDVALMPLEDRARIMQTGPDCDTGGFEYYSNGIFEFGSRAASAYIPADDHLYVDSFDWRDRHGQNWITSVKSQGGSGYCGLFTALGHVESLVRLYNNNSAIDVDLSEEDVALYNQYKNPYNTYHTGLLPSKVLNYVMTYGVTLENFIGFQNTDRPEKLYDVRPDSYPLTFIGNYQYEWNKTRLRNKLKQKLIKDGPQCLSYEYIKAPLDTGRHAMLLVGYTLLRVGDRITLFDMNHDVDYIYYVREGDEYVNQTCWIFKNSWGMSPNTIDGYVYAIFRDNECFTELANAIPPITGTDWDESMQVIADSDNDGYYTWGINRPKPVSLPAWVSDLQDGDDSDPSKGPMDPYGYLADLSYSDSDTIYVNTDTVIEDFQYLCHPMVVENGATLTIRSHIRCMANGQIIARQGSHVVLDDGAELSDISIVTNEASQINLHHNSRLNISRSGNNTVTLHRTH